MHLLPGKQTARLSDLPKAYHLLTIQKKQRESADSKTLSHSTSFQRDTLLDFLRTGKPSALPSFWAHYRADHRVGVFLLCLSLLSLYRAFLCGP